MSALGPLEESFLSTSFVSGATLGSVGALRAVAARPDRLPRSPVWSGLLHCAKHRCGKGIDLLTALNKPQSGDQTITRRC